MKAVKVQVKVDLRSKVKSDDKGEGGQREVKPRPRPTSGYNLSAGVK